MLKVKHSAQEGRTFIETLAYIMIMITVTVGVASVVRGMWEWGRQSRGAFSGYSGYLLPCDKHPKTGWLKTI